jgi:hypothetical protein
MGTRAQWENVARIKNYSHATKATCPPQFSFLPPALVSAARQEIREQEIWGPIPSAALRAGSRDVPVFVAGVGFA